MKNRKYDKLITLFLVALLAGVIWRAEVEWHGWRGLIWLTYFHYALPVNFLLVLAWININLPKIRPVQRILLNVLAVIYTFLTYLFIWYIIEHTMVPGMRGLMTFLETPRWLTNLLFIMPPFVLGGFPLGIYGILRAFHIRPSFKYLVGSVLLYLVSFLLACALLELFDHQGGSDYIHAIKSGFVFPLLVMATGILFLEIKSKNNSAISSLS